MSDTPVTDHVKHVLVDAVRRVREMDDAAFAAALKALLGDVELDGETPLVEVLKRLAGEGSIDALAMLVAVANDDDPIVNEAVEAFVRRIPEVRDELARAQLAEELEAWADEEVAAGRMTVRTDPETGRKLYSTKEGK